MSVARESLRFAIICIAGVLASGCSGDGEQEAPTSPPVFEGKYLLQQGAQADGGGVVTFTKDHRFSVWLMRQPTTTLTGTFRYEARTVHLVEDTTKQEIVWRVNELSSAAAAGAAPQARTDHELSIRSDELVTPSEDPLLNDAVKVVAAAFGCTTKPSIGSASLRPMTSDMAAPSDNAGTLCGLLDLIPSSGSGNPSPDLGSPANSNASAMVAEFKIAQNGSRESLSEANAWYRMLRDGMPNRHPLGFINDILKPFLNGIPMDCSDQAIYMANGFKSYGYQSGIVTADSWHGSHAYFYVIVNGQQYYGDTWDQSRSGLGLTRDRHPDYTQNYNEHPF